MFPLRFRFSLSGSAWQNSPQYCCCFLITMASELKHSQVMALPNHPSLHAHDYRQVVISLQGQTEFELSGRGSLVGPGQGCLVSESELHSFSGVGQNEILVINLPAPVLLGELGMKDRMDRLFDRDAYFQLDSQAQTLVKALTTEMIANPHDEMLDAPAQTPYFVSWNGIFAIKSPRAAMVTV